MQPPNLERVCAQELRQRDIRIIRSLYRTTRAAWFLGRTEDGKMVEIEACDRLLCDRKQLTAYAFAAASSTHRNGRVPQVIEADRSTYLLRPYKPGEPIWQCLLRPGRCTPSRTDCLTPGLLRLLATVPEGAPVPLLFFADSGEVWMDAPTWGPWAAQGEIAHLLSQWSSSDQQARTRQLYCRLVTGDWSEPAAGLTALVEAGNLSPQEQSLLERLASGIEPPRRIRSSIIAAGGILSLLLLLGIWRNQRLTAAQGWTGGAPGPAPPELLVEAPPLPEAPIPPDSEWQERARALVRLAQTGQYRTLDKRISRMRQQATTRERAESLEQAQAKARFEAVAAHEDEMTAAEALRKKEAYAAAIGRLQSYLGRLPASWGEQRSECQELLGHCRAAKAEVTAYRERDRKARRDQHRLESQILEAAWRALEAGSRNLETHLSAHDADFETARSRELADCIRLLHRSGTTLHGDFVEVCQTMEGRATLAVALPGDLQTGQITAVDHERLTITTAEQGIISKSWLRDFSARQRLLLWATVLTASDANVDALPARLHAYAELHQISAPWLPTPATEGCAKIGQAVREFVEESPQQ